MRAMRHRQRKGDQIFRVSVNLNLAVDVLVQLGAIDEPDGELIAGIEEVLSRVLESALRRAAKK